MRRPVLLAEVTRTFIAPQCILLHSDKYDPASLVLFPAGALVMLLLRQHTEARGPPAAVMALCLGGLLPLAQVTQALINGSLEADYLVAMTGELLFLSSLAYVPLRALVHVHNETGEDLYLAPAEYHGRGLRTRVRALDNAVIPAFAGIRRVTLAISDGDGRQLAIRNLAMRWLEPEQKEIVITEEDLVTRPA